jgi:endonuclease YncB( thermonuclease family)
MRYLVEAGPEKGQAFGQRAKQAMGELVFGKDVKLRPHTIDRYGRLVARVIVDNQDAGLELLKEGLCWVYERYLPEASPDIQMSYQQAQAAALEQKPGLWGDPFPVPPWDWRKGNVQRWALNWSVRFRLGAVQQLLRLQISTERYPAAGDLP